MRKLLMTAWLAGFLAASTHAQTNLWSLAQDSAAEPRAHRGRAGRCKTRSDTGETRAHKTGVKAVRTPHLRCDG